MRRRHINSATCPQFFIPLEDHLGSERLGSSCEPTASQRRSKTLELANAITKNFEEHFKFIVAHHAMDANYLWCKFFFQLLHHPILFALNGTNAICQQIEGVRSESRKSIPKQNK